MDQGAEPLAEAWNSGAWGGYLVTNEAADFDTYMDIHANPQVLPLLLALMGPAFHICRGGRPYEDSAAAGSRGRGWVHGMAPGYGTGDDATDR